jgi:hypothetical protein
LAISPAPSEIIFRPIYPFAGAPHRKGLSFKWVDCQLAPLTGGYLVDLAEHRREITGSLSPQANLALARNAISPVFL